MKRCKKKLNKIELQYIMRKCNLEPKIRDYLVNHAVFVRRFFIISAVIICAFQIWSIWEDLCECAYRVLNTITAIWTLLLVPVGFFCGLSDIYWEEYNEENEKQ